MRIAYDIKLLNAGNYRDDDDSRGELPCGRDQLPFTMQLVGVPAVQTLNWVNGGMGLKGAGELGVEVWIRGGGDRISI